MAMKSNNFQNNIFSNFVKKYNLSKTLRFELKPVKETKNHLKEFIELDTKRAKEYKELKKIIDEYHKDYIEKSLSSTNILNEDLLADFFDLWKNNKEDKNLLNKIKEKFDIKLKPNCNNKEAIEAIETKLRTDIAEHFKILNPLLESFFKTANDNQLLGFLKKFDKDLHKEFKENKNKAVLDQYLQNPITRSKSVLFEKDFIEYLLPAWVESSDLTEQEDKEKKEKQKIIKNFENFTTYLQGFYENRKNMYLDKDHSTAIAYRIINENLAKFFANIQSYEKIKSNHQELQNSFEEMNSVFKEEFKYFSLEKIDDFFKPKFFNKCLSQKGIDYYNTFIGGKTIRVGEETIREKTIKNQNENYLEEKNKQWIVPEKWTITRKTRTSQNNTKAKTFISYRKLI